MITVCSANLRNANAGQSSGPLEIDRPWDSYTDDHLGLMDHLAGRGINCPRPIHGRDGNALRNLAGKPAAITAWARLR